MCAEFLTYPLQGAFDRVDRADKHLAELEAEQRSFGQLYHDSLRVERKLDPPYELINPGLSVLPVPNLCSILLGEVAYNLRAALDYLIYELALRDSGSPQNGTQFPICDTKQSFDGLVKKYLIGIDVKHRAAIEVLQPYNRCNWIAQLRDISNPDKHRHLISSTHGFQIRMNTASADFSVEAAYAPAFQSKRRVEHPSKGGINVYLSTEAPIIADIGGRPEAVVELMKRIKMFVQNTLNGFKKEFE